MYICRAISLASFLLTAMAKQSSPSSFPRRSATPLAGGASTGAKKRPLPHLSSRHCHVVGFVLLWVFCVWIYGDVFRHIAEENFVAFDATAMHYVLHRQLGWLLWAGRVLLLPFKSALLGGTLLALLLTAAARGFATLFAALRLPPCAGYLPVLGLLGFLVWRGHNLYLRNEPSTFVLLAVGLALLAAGCILAVRCFASRRSLIAARGTWVAAAVALGAYGALTAYALLAQEGVRLSCRMQNQMLREDWQGMVETARSARRPTRTIAALHAIALLHTDRLLDGAFDIAYDYPPLALDSVGGADEGPNYIADANLHAGLVNSAYRSSMENTVVHGPRLHNYKRMAICALLNGERQLAERYFHLIGKMPFEADFVERYRPMLADSARVRRDATLARVLSLAPREHRFEQNYRQPAFLGYNVGMNQGTDAALITSTAACLYSKDLNAFLLRAHALRAKQTLPNIVLQALVIASVKREAVAREFPEINGLVSNQFQAFLTDALPYIQAQEGVGAAEKERARKEMAAALRDNWLGTYMYYYYCGNLDAPQKHEKGDGVN